MTRLAAAVITITVVATAGCTLSGCSDDTGGDVDAAIDAPVDVAIDTADGPCGAGYQMTGEYIDWDATTAMFDGVEDATWTLTTAPNTSAVTAPNGRIIICLPRETVTLTVEQTATPYVSAIFVADPAVLAVPGGIFSARGLKSADASARYTTITGAAFDADAAHVFVYKRGTPTAVTLGAQASYVSDGDDDTTWEAGSSGTFVLFPNVPVANGTATLGGTFTGPTTIPLEAGKLTIVPIS
ncbi:MAG: hypothetical protein F9K40_19890 [Kofleriaceae bacterium]|nr:MAG: hypothetical protein F9K40_19890 [Kofleriaceae bacterium]